VSFEVLEQKKFWFWVGFDFVVNPTISHELMDYLSTMVNPPTPVLPPLASDCESQLPSPKT
jgi:hypothetical protein